MNMLGWRLLLLASLIGVHAGSGANEVPGTWKTECIGRYQISVPSNVEVALTTLQEVMEGGVVSPIRFNDGSPASYAFFGGIAITPPITLANFLKIKRQEERDFQKYKNEPSTETSKDGGGKTKTMRPLETSVPNTFGWVSRGGASVYMHEEGRLFYYAFDHSTEDLSENENFANVYVKNFHVRKLFEVPEGQGICVPYGFLANNGKGWRKIGVAMRLKDHPDIEIFFQDETPFMPREGYANRNAEEEMEFFWGREYGADEKAVELEWPSYRSVELDGRKGKYTFAKIIHLDNSLDYGYLAYVKGDPKAAADTPNLMFYVIRTAARAAPGTIPVSRSELKKMAQQIAASIRRRPANQ